MKGEPGSGQVWKEETEAAGVKGLYERLEECLCFRGVEYMSGLGFNELQDAAGEGGLER